MGLVNVSLVRGSGSRRAARTARSAAIVTFAHWVKSDSERK